MDLYEQQARKHLKMMFNVTSALEIVKLFDSPPLMLPQMLQVKKKLEALADRRVDKYLKAYEAGLRRIFTDDNIALADELLADELKKEEHQPFKRRFAKVTVQFGRESIVRAAYYSRKAHSAYATN